MSKEYIERGALLKYLCNSCDGWCENTNCDCVNCKSEHRCDMVQEIEEAPNADVVEVKHGWWEMRKAIIFDDELIGYRCSECKTTLGHRNELLPELWLSYGRRC